MAFAILLLIILVLSVFLLRQQFFAQQKFEYTSQTLVPLSQSAKTVHNDILMLNKLVNTHTNLLEKSEMKKIKKEIKGFSKKLEEDVSNLLRELEKTLGDKSAYIIYEEVQKQSLLAKELMSLNEDNLDSLMMRTQALEKMDIQVFSSRLDFNDAIRILEGKGRNLVSFTIDEASSMTSHINQVINKVVQLPSISDSWEVEDSGSEINDHIMEVKSYRDSILRRHPEIENELIRYTQSVIDPIEFETGVYNSHLKWLSSSKLRQQSYMAYSESIQKVAIDLDNTVQKLEGLVQVSSTEAAKIGQQSISTGVIVLSIAMVLTISIGHHIYKSISTPLKEIEGYLVEIASGNLVASVPERKKDEFGVISQNINSLAEALQKIIRSVTEVADNLETLSEEASSVNEIAKKQANEQKEMTGNFNKKTNIMKESTEQTRVILGDMHQQVIALTTRANENAEGMEKNARKIYELEEKMNIASSSIDQLSSQSDAISVILEVIQKIAGQTNLLALNAAIEAARAGEAGRGFSVVADEVRNLATKTRESTDEIHNVIESLQTKSKEAVKIITLSSDLLKECVLETKKTKENTEDIKKVVVNLSKQNNDVDNYSKQQNHLISEVSDNIIQIVGSATNTAEMVSKSTESNRKLLALVSQQRSLLRHFKII